MNKIGNLMIIIITDNTTNTIHYSTEPPFEHVGVKSFTSKIQDGGTKY